MAFSHNCSQVLSRIPWRIWIGLWICPWIIVTELSAQQLTLGTSSRSAKDEVIASIPLEELTPDSRQKITDVLQHSSLYRRLPVSSIEVDPDYFRLMVRYPEIVVETWRLMEVTQMETERTGPYSLHSNDGAGTISDIELVYGNNSYHLYYGAGTYEGPLNRRPLQGRCVIVLRTEYGESATGAATAINHCDVFLKVDNMAAGFVARTLSPIVGKTADHNFIESLNFVQRLNETTEKNGPGVQGMAHRLTGLSADVRDRFVQCAGNVFEKKQLRVGASPASKPALYSTAPSSLNTGVNATNTAVPFSR